MRPGRKQMSLLPSKRARRRNNRASPNSIPGKVMEQLFLEPLLDKDKEVVSLDL